MLVLSVKFTDSTILQHNAEIPSRKTWVVCFSVCLQIIYCLTQNQSLGVSEQGTLKLFSLEPVPVENDSRMKIKHI